MKIINYVLLSFLVVWSADAQSLTNQIEAVDAVQQENDAAQRVVQKAKQAEAANRQKHTRLEKQRDQTYQDKLRDLEIQEKALRLDVQKARISRVNEYIDQELKEQAAETDVIKSHADATRDLSQGTKTLLEKTGEAVVKDPGMFSKK